MSDLNQTLQSLYDLYKTGAYVEAENGAREALNKWPDEIDALKLGALTALALNQTVTAHQRIDTAIARAPMMTAEIANIFGRVLNASGEWAAAEEMYEKALKLDPSFDRAQINRLHLLTTSEQPKRVLAVLKEGYDFGTTGDLARGQALTDLGRYDEALITLNAIEDQAYQDRVLFLRVKCFAALGQLKKMDAAFSALSVESQLYPKALNLVVNCFEMRGKRKASLSHIETSAKHPNPPVGLQAIRLLRKLDQGDEANSKLENLLQAHPENSKVLCEAADVARLEGRAGESCEIYIRALTLRPGDFGALSGFTQAAIVAGRFSQAQAALQAALNQAPNSQFLLALLAALLRQTDRDHTYLYDYKNYVRVYDIAPPTGYDTILDFNKALKKKLNKLHTYKKAPINQSLRLGTQTELDLSLIDDPVLSGFFDAVDAPIRDYMKTIGHNPNHPLRRRNRGEYRIQGAWSVKLKGNGHHVNHVHPMGWLSSAYYVDLPKTMTDTNKEGWIKFGEPNLAVNQTAEHYVQPKAGRLVLFPSYMWHGTVPFKGSDTRLTLPFDAVPA